MIFYCFHWHVLHKVPFASFLRFTSKSFVLSTTITTLRAGKRGNLHATVISISIFSLMQINYFRWDKKRADPLGFYRFASLMINFRRYLLHWCLIQVIKGFFTLINVQKGLLRVCKKLKVDHIFLRLVVQRNWVLEVRRFPHWGEARVAWSFTQQSWLVRDEQICCLHSGTAIPHLLPLYFYILLFKYNYLVPFLNQKESTNLHCKSHHKIWRQTFNVKIMDCSINIINVIYCCDITLLCSSLSMCHITRLQSKLLHEIITYIIE